MLRGEATEMAARDMRKEITIICRNRQHKEELLAKMRIIEKLMCRGASSPLYNHYEASALAAKISRNM